MTLNDYERERGVIIKDANGKKPDDTVSEDEFNGFLADPLNFSGVNWDDREAFLRANGYKVNRANMVDSSLSSKQGASE